MKLSKNDTRSAFILISIVSCLATRLALFELLPDGTAVVSSPGAALPSSVPAGSEQNLA